MIWYRVARLMPSASAICCRGIPASMHARTALRRDAESASAFLRDVAAFSLASLACASSLRASSSDTFIAPQGTGEPPPAMGR